MEDDFDEFTEFRLFLPDFTAKKDECINQNLSKRAVFIGESIDVWVVARYRARTSKSEDEDVTSWKNRLSSFCVELNVRAVENEGDITDFQSHTFFIDDMPEASDITTRTFIPCDVVNLNDYLYNMPLPNTTLIDSEPLSPMLSRTQARKSGNTKSRKSQLTNESGMSTWPRRRKDRNMSENNKENNPDIEGISTFHHGPTLQAFLPKNDISFQTKPKEIDEKTLVFQMTVTLDSLPPSCNQVCITAWIWTTEYDRMEYLATRPPVPDTVTEVGNGEKLIAKAVSHILPVKQPPDVMCRQYSVGGNHFLSLKVCNNLALPIALTGTRVLYAFTDYPSHDKPEELVSLIGEQSSLFPARLLPGEETNFIFIINMANFQSWEEEIRLLGLVMWTYAQEQTTPVHSYYKLPCLLATQAAFVFSASGHQKVQAGQTFTVSYKIQNQIHDFLSIKMNWRPDKALNDGKEMSDIERRHVMSVINNVICQEPSVQLGACRMGATLTYSVTFQILKPGMYELGKHMRLSLHYGVNPPNLETRRPSTTSLGAQLKNAIFKPNIFNRTDSRSGSIDDGDQRSPKLRLASTHNTPTPSRKELRLSNQSVEAYDVGIIHDCERVDLSGSAASFSLRGAEKPDGQKMECVSVLY